MASLTAPIHIIYASTGGNTEHVMEQVAQYWREQGVTVELHRSEQTPLSVITNNKYFLFATSTWDHGAINPFFLALLKEMKTADFSGKTASFIGLGDRRYEKYYFCSGMTAIKEIWEKSKGRSVGVALTIGREPFETVIEEMVKKWADETLPLYESQAQGQAT
ncbi:MAG: putative flavodoxin-2 [Patescibacteria group bacterium]|nr:MAG: putative flavodoxin-2 [Patescibacteria group bacterium]